MLIQAVYNWLNNNQDQCLLCLASDKPIQQGLCDPCRSDLPWLGSRCRQCALPLPGDDLLCGQCQQHPPAFSQVVCPLLYRFPVDSLIPAFKYHGQLGYGRLLMNLLAEHVRYHYEEHHQSLPDALIPMPLHSGRQAARGYNQALELARPLARLLDRELLGAHLQRTRSTQPQQGLNARERRRNLRGAFRCNHPDQVTGKHLALVDDVLTTGTTADEASRTLLQAGALSVSVWCVARTP